MHNQYEKEYSKSFFQAHPSVKLVGGWDGVLGVTVVPPVQL